MLSIQPRPFPSSNPHEHLFFLFVNPKSGNGIGRNYLSLHTPYLELSYQSSHHARVYIFDLFNQLSREQGFTLLKAYSLQIPQTFIPSSPSKESSSSMTIPPTPRHSSLIKIIVCGGDGTLSWIITEIYTHQIPLNNLIFGVIPIGTGNDFSRSLGWGTKPIKLSNKNFGTLAPLIFQFMTSRTGKYDIWNVIVETSEEGKIYDIKDQVEIERTTTSFGKLFVNYVGIGLDARVVYTVERKRTKNAFLNKVVYGLVGFCNFFRPMKKLEEVVEQFGQYNTINSEYFEEYEHNDNKSDNDNEEDKDSQQSTNSPNEKIIIESPSNKLITLDHEEDMSNITHSFIAKQEHDLSGQQGSIYNLKHGYCGLVCLNCPSYMAGIRKVWQTTSLGLQEQPETPFSPQCYDDGMVEFVSFKNELNLALERVIRSGSKVAQGKGPFILKMKLRKNEETYMQIDGESIKIKELKSVTITRGKQFGGQINVLVNHNHH